MGLHTVPISGGIAPLGRWGTLALTGAASAIVQLTQADDIELPAAIAANITTPNVRLLNDELGRLLFLPYDGELVAAYDLSEGQPVGPPVVLSSRDPDHGMRTADFRLIEDLGVVYLTESLLALFREDCTLAWRVENDFAGWSFEGVTPREINLVRGDWSGREEHQMRSVADGTRLD